MTFKEDLESDIPNTFFCADEFAEMHLVDGVEMMASVIKKSHERREHNLRSHERGIYDKQVVLFAAAADFGSLPTVRQPIMLDGKQYLVKAAEDECGMYRITLGVT